MKTIAVIPARFNSSRFPGKPLAEIHGKPMLWWVYNAVQSSKGISETYVATDSSAILDTVISFGGNAIITGECACGTDRVAEACRELEFDVVLNIQSDEPMVRQEFISSLLGAYYDKRVEIATLRKRISSTVEVNDPNIAKVIFDHNEDAIYFSRCAIPYNKSEKSIVYYKHIGMYAFTRDSLFEFASLPVSNLEIAESLEQLRAIENGLAIRTVETEFQSIGVDLPEHIALVENELAL